MERDLTPAVLFHQSELTGRSLGHLSAYGPSLSRLLEHFPAKWMAVRISLAMFRNSDIAEKMRQIKKIEPFSDSIKSENALGSVRIQQLASSFETRAPHAPFDSLRAGSQDEGLKRSTALILRRREAPSRRMKSIMGLNPNRTLEANSAKLDRVFATRIRSNFLILRDFLSLERFRLSGKRAGNTLPMKPHAIYISSRWPWPPRSGRDKMIHQSIQGLSREFSITYVLVGSAVESSVPPLNVDKVLHLSRPNVLEIIWNLFSKPALTLQERLFFSRRNLRLIKELSQSTRAKAIVVDMIRMSPYLPTGPAFDGILKICDMDDLLSKRYRQLAKRNNLVFNPFGTFGNDQFFKVLGTLARPVRGLIFFIEAALIERREIDMGLMADLVLLVSPIEAAELSSKTAGHGNVVAFPPAMPMPPQIVHETTSQPSAPGESVTLLYVGDLRTPANILAMNFILDEILPTLRLAKVEYQMVVVGRTEDDDMAQKLHATPQLSYLGWVDDLSDVYAQADVVVCPFVVGTGVKLKVLEAMSNGKAVVTNKIGVEGISAQDGAHIVVAEGKEMIANAIIGLAENRDLRRKIGAAAAAFIMEHHDPLSLQIRLGERLRRCLSDVSACI